VAHLLGLFQAGPGILLTLVIAPRLTHDLAHVQAVEPRVKTRRPKPFPLMITPRHELRQPLIQPALSGSLHGIRPRA
jgi:hypothetical protein